jgi:hypothetical protein
VDDGERHRVLPDVLQHALQFRPIGRSRAFAAVDELLDDPGA